MRSTAVLSPPTAYRAGTPRVPGTLLLAQAMGSLGLAAGGTAGSLLITQLTGKDTLSAVPLGLLVVGSAASAPLALAVMRRRSRAVGLVGSYLVATAGAWLVVIAADAASVALLLLGSALLGAGNAAVMLGRYVAADSVPAGRSGIAISRALTAVTIGAVLGPILLAPAGELAGALGLPQLTGLYLLAGVIFPVAATVMLGLSRASDSTPPQPSAESVPPARPGGRFLPPLVLGSANLAMVVVMAVMPAHMRMGGWSLAALGLLVAGHVAAMFGPSPVSGWLSNRFGPTRTALVGSVLFLVAIALTALAAYSGDAVTGGLGLICLGFAWNLQLIGGTSLLIQRTPPALRYRTEGFGEAAMGIAAAVGTLGLATPLLDLGGIPLLCAALGVLVALVALPLLRESVR